MVQRILDILHFLWAIVLAMVDGLTQWLNLLTKQYRDTSTVLCNERYFIIHKIQKVYTTHTHFCSAKTDLWNRHRQTHTHTPSNLCVSPSDWQHHTTADSTDDQVSQGSESPTMETCLDETDAENSSRYRLVWTRVLVTCVFYQPHVDETHHS